MALFRASGWMFWKHFSLTKLLNQGSSCGTLVNGCCIFLLKLLITIVPSLGRQVMPHCLRVVLLQIAKEPSPIKAHPGSGWGINELNHGPQQSSLSFKAHLPNAGDKNLKGTWKNIVVRKKHTDHCQAILFGVIQIKVNSSENNCY